MADNKKYAEVNINPDFRKIVEKAAFELVAQGLSEGKVSSLLGNLGLFIDNKPKHALFEFEFKDIETLTGKKIYVGSNED